MSNPTIWQVTLPSGSVYDVEDKVARQAASHGVTFKKVTNAADTPYGVTWDDDGTTITGTLVASANTEGNFYLVPATTQSGKDIYGEYITVEDGTEPNITYSWEKIGTTDIDLSNLGNLAYKSSATGQFTPEGSITVNTASGTGTSYTPEGSVSAPSISVASAGSTASVTPFGSAGSLPSLSMTVQDGNLTISFDQGTLPSAGSAVTVKTGDASYEASTPTFTGEEKKFAFAGTQGTVSVS